MDSLRNIASKDINHNITLSQFNQVVHNGHLKNHKINCFMHDPYIRFLNDFASNIILKVRGTGRIIKFPAIGQVKYRLGQVQANNPTPVLRNISCKSIDCNLLYTFLNIS